MPVDDRREVVRRPESLDAVLREIDLAAGVDPHLDAALARLRADLDDPDEAGARRLVERLALCLAGSLLLRHGAPAVAQAFCVTRLGGDGGRTYGTLPRGVDAASIVERHRPRV